MDVCLHQRAVCRQLLRCRLECAAEEEPMCIEVETDPGDPSTGRERVLDKERALQCRFCPRQKVVILPDLDMAKSAAFHSDNAAPCESLAAWFKGLVIVSDK